MGLTVLPAAASLPTTTRSILRRLVGRDVAGEGFFVDNIKASPAPAIDRFAVEGFVDRAGGSEGEAFRDKYVYVPTQGAGRRILEVTPSTGLAVLHRDLPSIPTVGAEVEVHRFDPTLINEAINDGLSRMLYSETLELTPESSSYATSLAAYDYIRRKEDVIGVWTTPTGVDTAPPIPADWYSLDFNGNYWELHLGTQYPAVYLRVRRPYAPLNSDTATTTAKVEWVRAAARVALYKKLIDRSSGGKEGGVYQRGLVLALSDFRRLSVLNQPRGGRRMAHSTPMWGDGHVETV